MQQEIREDHDLAALNRAKLWNMAAGTAELGKERMRSASCDARLGLLVHEKAPQRIDDLRRDFLAIAGAPMRGIEAGDLDRGAVAGRLRHIPGRHPEIDGERRGDLPIEAPSGRPPAITPELRVAVLFHHGGTA